jgi:LssY C-terminus
MHTTSPAQQSSRWRRTGCLGLVALASYLAIAYLLMPTFWTRYTRRHSAFDNLPRITRAGDGLPGDPLNVALIGTEDQLKRIMLAAKWYPADALTLRSCLRIAEDTVLKRAYTDAPVSNLYLLGRREDLAFEQPVGGDPRRRHHVRFWRVPGSVSDEAPSWAGAATFDRSVGISHTTGQVTHHIAADVDAERDHLFEDLKRTGDLAETRQVPGYHLVRAGRNGGGDPWHTDGDLYVGTIGAIKAP